MKSAILARKIMVIAMPALFLGAIFIAPEIGLAQSNTSSSSAPESSIAIDRDGKTSVSGAIVKQIAGTNIFAESRFGSASVRWVLTTKPTTKIVKRFGEAITVAAMKEGDVLNFSGVLDASSSSLLVQTSLITDWSRTDGSAVFSGTVSALSSGDGSFTLQTKDKGAIKVTASSTVMVIKGKFRPAFSEIKVGDRISAASGVYNYTAGNLSATVLEIYQDKGIFLPRNFQGKLKSVSLDTSPKTMIVAIDGKDYTVQISADAPVLNALRVLVSLQRFVVGDTVRIYGMIKDDDLSVINAELVRNVSL